MNEKLHQEVINLRKTQYEIHERCYEEGVKVPIHFAFGHEAVAVAVASAKQERDKVLLTHRNIHYHLALGASKESVINQYLLRGSETGSVLGSMNFQDSKYGSVYTSNILGNNLAVATGIALGENIQNTGGVVWCATGDGAIEEGTFYESLLLASSKGMPIIYIIENNEWSLASKIPERRVDINISYLAKCFDINFDYLSNNNVLDYSRALTRIRSQVSRAMKPSIIVCDVVTLGGYFVNDNQGKRYVNYHSGQVKSDQISSSYISEDPSDPVWISISAREDC